MYAILWQSMEQVRVFSSTVGQAGHVFFQNSAVLLHQPCLVFGEECFAIFRGEAQRQLAIRSLKAEHVPVQRSVRHGRAFKLHAGQRGDEQLVMLSFPRLDFRFCCHHRRGLYILGLLKKL
jgi:hypothetical protein